jgi:hypothetical protein
VGVQRHGGHGTEITEMHRILEKVLAHDQLSSMEALELTVLIAKKDPRRGSRASAQWLSRFLDENERVTIQEAALAAGALAALGGPGHEEAHGVLAGMVERAVSQQQDHAPEHRSIRIADSPMQ